MERISSMYITNTWLHQEIEEKNVACPLVRRTKIPFAANQEIYIDIYIFYMN